MALAIRKIVKNSQGIPVQVEIFTENQYGELVIATFARVHNKIKLISIELPNRSIMENLNELKIPKKSFSSCVRLAASILPRKVTKQPRILYYNNYRDPYSCPYCGYLDPALVEAIKRGEIIYKWKCPNCGKIFPVPGNDKPLYWSKGKKKKGGEK